MKTLFKTLLFKTLLALVAVTTTSIANAQLEMTRVRVTIENVAPDHGVALTPAWVGFHSGSFDSYNGGLSALEGLERIAEDGDATVLSRQFNDFNEELGGYTYVDNSGEAPESALVRTGDLTDANRIDGMIGAAPLLPGESASQEFELMLDGSNSFFSYAAMVLPSNDFFVANGNPMAHDLSDLLDGGESVTFFIGTPNGGVNDAGTERETFFFSAGNGLFPDRNLPDGQPEANKGPRDRNSEIRNVTGRAYRGFRTISRRNALQLALLRATVRSTVRRLLPLRRIPAIQRAIDRLNQSVVDFRERVTIDVSGFNFNRYENGIARVTIELVPEGS